MRKFGKVKPGSTLYIPFDTYAGSTGASSTPSGLAVGDILIYKNGSTTERSSTTGYTLLDTDGIDFDGKTGINGFSIDLSSNADSGFFVAGAEYWVVVSAIMVDSQTASFTAATFTIGYEGATLDTTIATLSTQASFTLTAGPAEDNALNDCVVIIHDIASATQFGYAIIQDYVGSTKTVTLEQGTTFTVAAGDNISIFPPIKLPQISPIPANIVSIAGNTGAPALLANWASSFISDTVMGAGADYVDVAAASGDLLGWLVYDADNIGARLIVAWDDGTKRATITPPWVTQPTGDVLITPGGAAILTAAGLQSDAVTEIQAGLSTLDAAGVRTAVGLASANLDTQFSNIATNVWAAGTRTLTSFGTLVSDIWSAGTRTLTAFAFSVTVGTNNDKTGYTLSAAGIQAIWDALTAALSTANSIGKLLVDNINATISSRSSHSAADVWAVGTRTLTSFGTLAADVWASATRTLTAFAFGVDVTSISGSSAAADKAEEAFKSLVTGTAVTGTLSTTQMTTNLTETTNDHYNGRLITWTSGVLDGQQTDITDYDGASKMLTFTAITEAPSNGDTFVIT